MKLTNITKKVRISTQNFCIPVFSSQKIAIFRNSIINQIFFNLKKRMVRFFQQCFRSLKKQFLSKNDHWFDNENLLKIFNEIFGFLAKNQIFAFQNFFTDFVPQDLRMCCKSGLYIGNWIFLSSFVENCQFQQTQLILGP